MKSALQPNFKAEKQEIETAIIQIGYKIRDLEFQRLKDLANMELQARLLELLKEEYELNQMLADFQAKELIRKADDEAILTLLMVDF